MNKKGFMNVFIFMIVGFIIAVTVVILVYTATVTYTKMQEQSPAIQKMLGSNHNATEMISGTLGRVPNAYESLKWFTGILIMGLALGILVSAYYTRTHHLFFGVYILIWIIAVIVSVPLSNTYEVLYNNPTLGSTFQGFWAQSFIFANLYVWVIVLGGLAALFMIINMIRYSNTGGYG